MGELRASIANQEEQVSRCVANIFAFEPDGYLYSGRQKYFQIVIAVQLNYNLLHLHPLKLIRLDVEMKIRS